MPRSLVRPHTGRFVLERSDGPPLLLENSELQEALTPFDSANADVLARVLSLVGAEVDLIGFPNLGFLIESQLGIHTTGPRPDIGGYELKTLSAAPKVDRPFLTLFGKAPERLVARSDLIERFSRNGSTVDFGRLRLGRPGQFSLGADAKTLWLVAPDGERLMAWVWVDLQARLEEKMSKLVLLTCPSTGSSVRVRDAIVSVDPRGASIEELAHTRDFLMRVRLQQRSGRDTFEFSTNTAGLRKIYERWLSVRPVDD